MLAYIYIAAPWILWVFKGKLFNLPLVISASKTYLLFFGNKKYVRHVLHVSPKALLGYP